ncbi:hypothetical protein BgiMline_013478, partial [Biomphalaria glabrata]
MEKDGQRTIWKRFLSRYRVEWRRTVRELFGRDSCQGTELNGEGRSENYLEEILVK